MASGNVSISATSPTSLTISQSSRTGIVNWSSFSIGQGNQVQFNNGSGATLNRVTGNVPSSINGVLSATGSVYLVNPSGVVVGPSGVVNTGGSFVASTLDVKDAEFRAGGSLTFSGSSNASVVNLGKIGASKGDVVLIARQVRNDGSLTARNGTAAMASGSEVVLSDGALGNGKVLVRRPAQDGEIRNSGAIRAAEVELRANGGNIYALAGNTGRAITATGVASKGGRIFLTAEGGSVNVTQKVVARRIQADVATAPTRVGIVGRRAFTGGDVVVSGDKVVLGGTIEAKGNGGVGGTVVVTGTDVTLTSGAAIDASGTSGGTVLIGGDRAGGSDAALKFLPQTIANAQAMTIEAGATITADGTSGAGGNVVVWSDGTTSFGGAISTQGLRGGFIETSGHVFDFAGGSVNAGPGGTWLLDPVDLTINSTLAATIATALNGGSNVTQLTSASGTGGNGDITVASGISWSTNATLTLSAYRNIVVDANITSSGGGGVVLRADNAGTGTGMISGGGLVSTAGTVSVYYNPTGSNSTINATKYTAPTQVFYSGNIAGGATLKTYMLVNTVYDLQNMNNNKAGTYALGRDIDAGITSTWNSGAGFQPIGAGNSLTGNLDGQGHTISNLFINRPADQNVGLISYLAAGASVSNVGVIGATITGHTTVGGIVGNNYGAITNVYSSGSVTAISAGAGGLVGYNFQTLSNSYSNSAVSGPLYVGGAVGLNNIAAGPTAGLISQVYATGAVTGTGGAPSAIGGLVGYNGNTITQSYWDSYTTGQASGVGAGGSAGATAVTSDPAQSAAANYAFKQSAYGSFSFPGTGSTGWYMVDGQTRPFGRWEYQTTITNAHQLQLMAMNLGASYTLAGSIDLGPSLAAVGGKYPGMWSSAGFVPIGNGSTKFTGAFDGQGRTIANLAINRPAAAYGGLFGYIGSSATISDIGLIGVNVSGSIYTGTLVGSSEGTITRAYATGVVTAGSDIVGGLVANNSGAISRSYAAVTVTESGGGHSAGGLVGSNGGLIELSYSTGAVSSGGTRVGGLVGGNSGNVQLSYATGAVSGVSDVGGLVGYHTNFGSIAQSYAAGAVSGASPVGGLVGTSNNSAMIGQSYWDTVTSGRANGVGSGPTTGATGLTTSQMQNPANYATTYAGWDFTNVWSAPSAGYYPQLYGVNYVLRVDPANALRAYGDANPAFTYTYYGLHTGDTSAILGGLSLSTTATTMSNIGSYAITAGGSIISTAGQAYRLIQTPAALTVTQRAITVTADAKSRAYGDANPALTYQVGGSGLVNGDTLSGALATPATTASNVGTYGITQGTLAASGNYALNYAAANLTVTQRAITVTADAKSRAYGDVNPALTYQVGGSGLVNGDSLSGALATSATTSSNVGAYGITQGTLAASSNYALNYASNNLTVTQRALTVTADAKSRAYGDANPALTYQVGGSGLVNGDSLSGALATSATTASNVGTYGINQGTLAASTNYALNYAAANLTVTQRALTVTADAKSRAYGDANPALTYQVGGSGLVNGDTLSGALATSATTASNVGTYGITQGTLAASGNYALNYASANLTVGQRAITVTADAKSRAYGDVNPALTYQVGGSGLVNGDTLSGALATSATTASNVGVYGINQGTLAASGNYALNYSSANLTVGQRAITVTADDQSRAYGDANPVLTYQIGSSGGPGLVNGDMLSGALATSATTASNVGTYGIGQGTLAASANYALNYEGANLTVTQRAITVTADAKSRAYGDVNPALTYQVGGSGLANGDTLSGALATSATTASNIGVYGINQGTLAASGNYALNYASANLTVTQRAITVTADAKSRAYGDANPALTYQVGGSGLVNGDSLSGALATSATTASNVGVYGITQGTLASSGNYALNYASNDLTVTQRAITVTADAKSRAYGDANPALTYQVGGSGLVNGDGLSGALATSATAASNVGTYAIGQGTLAASGNYALNYTSANLTVGLRALTVTADAKSRAYGDANPALTYQVGGSGLVNGDTLSGALATSATTASNVGTYGINQGTLAASGNYALNYASNDLTVGQRALTVTADAKSRAYGDANPALTYQVGGSGLVNGDSLSGALATSATAASNVGTYGIGQGTLAASSNYALNYTGANLTVGQRALTVTADAKSRAYGDANPALTYQVGGSGLVNGDSLSGALATSATAASNVGTYGIGQGTLAASSNYALNYTGANLTVGQRALTVTADAKSRAYGDTNPALTYQVGGSGLVNGDSLSGALATSATTASNVGTYGINQGTLAASGNYALNYASNDLTVTQRALTVTADAKSRAYGDANPALTYQVSGSGLVNGDSLSGALATSATTTSNVGTYGIGQGTLAASGNYALNYASNNLTVTQRAITVTADAKSRAYGDTNPALTYQVGGSGLANGDSLSGALVTSATTSSNVGTYGIAQGSLAASGNYALNYASADLTVTQRAITVTADAKSRAYGDANPALTYQVGGSGLANGDSLSGALATSAMTSSNVGIYGITQGTLAASGNYALNYTSADLTVTQRAITVTADAKSRAYGDTNPALTYQVGGAGLANGDSLSGVLATSATAASNVGAYGITQGTLAASTNYALNYASANLTVAPRAITVTADAKSRTYGDVNPALTYQVGGAGLVNGDSLSGALETSATAASNVGAYGIAQGSLAASTNYALNYASANLTVTQRAITVTTDSQSRAYGDTNPALTYQVGGSGLANGDTLSGALATSATAASNVGVYGITQGSLAASTNYALNYTSANLTVTPRAITVTADAKSRAYGDTNPALTYQVGGSGLANGDILSGALATSATTSSNVGVYGINQGTLAASSNYAFAFVGANLTVTPAAAPRVPTAELAAYVKSRVALPAPQPPEQMREPVSIEQPSAAIVCNSRQCLELPHPHNRRIGERARFVDTMINRNRLPAFVDN